ncbi:leishmanolysin-like peptidase, partial [Tanacetum coccineum]
MPSPLTRSLPSPSTRSWMHTVMPNGLDDRQSTSEYLSLSSSSKGAANGMEGDCMHVLGFDAHAFTYFRDERKRRRRQVTEQAMDALTASLWGSHRKKRLLRNEIMMGSIDTRSVVSKMTLALLEDSRWYKLIIVWQTILIRDITKGLT